MKLFVQCALLFGLSYAEVLLGQDFEQEPVQQEPQQQVQEQTLDIKRLWLPKSYNKYWSNLQQVAEYQLSQARCTDVLRAELDIGQSSLDAPIFAVVCRDENKKTFVEKFDGLSFTSLSPKSAQPIDETVEEPVADVDLLPVIYRRCQELWAGDVALMKTLVWLDDLDDFSATERVELDTDDNPETTTTVSQYTFVRRFNAEDAAGNQLKYFANCTGSSLDDTHTNLSIRRTETR